MSTYFHGSTKSSLDIADGMDLCLTDEQAIAEAYGARSSSPWHLHTIDVVGGNFADESDVWDTAGELDDVAEMDHYSESDWRRQYVYELIDRDDVREALSAAGFDGVVYDDLSPDNSHTHSTLRVWSASVIRTESA